jgi:hypothetical protein
MTTFPLLAVLSLAIAGIQLEKVVSHDLYSSQPPYRAEDDVSWAIHSPQLSTLLGDHTQKLYDEFITNCKKAVAETDDNDNPRICLDDEENRMLMNKYQPASVYNYTRQGFAKIRAPEKMFKLISKFYRLNQGRDTKEWKQINTYHNLWDAPPTICHLNQRENSGGGPHLQAILFGQAKRVLEDWTGQELAPVSLYGIRLYHNGSILAPHVDRMPLIISAISKCFVVCCVMGRLAWSFLKTLQPRSSQRGPRYRRSLAVRSIRARWSCCQYYNGARRYGA